MGQPLNHLLQNDLAKVSGREIIALVLRFRISVLVLGLALLLKWDAG
jgi:hypothetical protein